MNASCGSTSQFENTGSSPDHVPALPGRGGRGSARRWRPGRRRKTERWPRRAERAAEARNTRGGQVYQGMQGVVPVEGSTEKNQGKIRQHGSEKAACDRKTADRCCQFTGGAAGTEQARQ
ncbi:MAG: hypothetical protein FVQ81_03635 [Candidatus Glassbacteria bacterium]|nr:hypothetical protein [Candidatus Glassbacteria bacterium]